MANILPVSDLRNYNEVLKNCHKGEPVYLTNWKQNVYPAEDGSDIEMLFDEMTYLILLAYVDNKRGGGLEQVAPFLR